MIASTSNKQVKYVMNLRDKAKVRREEGLFIAEGLRMCRELNPKETRQVYVTEAFARDEQNRRIGQCDGAHGGDENSPGGPGSGPSEKLDAGFDSPGKARRTCGLPDGPGNHSGPWESRNHPSGRGGSRNHRGGDEPGYGGSL